MKALIYLMCTQFKNRILYIRKKPGLMILYGFVLLIIIASVLFLIFATEGASNWGNADNRIIYLFISGFGLLYLYNSAYTGISTGSTFFTMADVGLLFVAPISSIKILIYGLVSTIGKAILASLFIFYQIPNLRNMFGYGFKEIFALFFIYSIMTIFNQILSIGVYVFSNGKQNRKKVVQLLLYGFIGILIIGLIFIIQKEQVNLLEGLFLLVDSKWFGYMPVVGWVVMFFKGILTGSLINVIISLAMFILISILCISLLTSYEADYYEDVLYSTEVTFQRVRDAKEGRNVSLNTNRKIKVKEKSHGIHKGKGAFVFAYKHFVEMKRSSPFIFINIYTVIATIGTGIVGYYITEKILPYIILATLIYLQYFMTILGRLKMELIKPYIYMIPEPSYKKLFAASISSLLKPCVDSIFIFGALALVGGAGIMECIFMALAYSASGAVFIGLTIVYQRVLGSQPNMLGQVFIGIFLLIIIITPAITASVITAIYILPESLQFLNTLPYSIVCLIMAFIMFFACRNLIDKAEYTGKI